jgi:D-alanyl-D-alanine carboxypeptidase (penicillin-binding protein 5/6)
MILPKGADSGLEASITLDEPLIAPLDREQQVGVLTLSLKGKQIGIYPLVILDAVGKGSWVSRMFDTVRLRFR